MISILIELPAKKLQIIFHVKDIVDWCSSASVCVRRKRHLSDVAASVAMATHWPITKGAGQSGAADCVARSSQWRLSVSSIRAEVAHRKRTEEEGEIVWGGGANHILPLPPCSQSHSTHRPHLKNATFNSFPVKLNLGLPSDRSDSTSRLRNSKWQAKEKTTTKRLLKTEWPAAP